MNKLRLLIAAFFGTAFAVTSVFALIAPVSGASLFDGSKDEACNGANLQDSGGCTGAGDQSQKINNTLQTIISVFSFVVAVVAVFMIIIGGIRFVTSQGDANSISAARNTIIYAVVGLVVAGIAQFAVKFVIGKTAK